MQKVSLGQPESWQYALSPSALLHVRAWHVESSGQKLPHWLQLLESVVGLTQVPPQHRPAWVERFARGPRHERVAGLLRDARAVVAPGAAGAGVAARAAVGRVVVDVRAGLGAALARAGGAAGERARVHVGAGVTGVHQAHALSAHAGGPGRAGGAVVAAPVARAVAHALAVARGDFGAGGPLAQCIPQLLQSVSEVWNQLSARHTPSQQVPGYRARPGRRWRLPRRCRPLPRSSR